MITRLEIPDLHIQFFALEGELLMNGPKNQGAIPGKTGTKTKPVLDPTPTLAEQNITKKESSQAQAYATVKTEDPKAFGTLRRGSKMGPREIRDLWSTRARSMLRSCGWTGAI